MGPRRNLGGTVRHIVSFIGEDWGCSASLFQSQVTWPPLTMHVINTELYNLNVYKIRL